MSVERIPFFIGVEKPFFLPSIRREKAVRPQSVMEKVNAVQNKAALKADLPVEIAAVFALTKADEIRDFLRIRIRSLRKSGETTANAKTIAVKESLDTAWMFGAASFFKWWGAVSNDRRYFPLDDYLVNMPDSSISSIPVPDIHQFLSEL